MDKIIDYIKVYDSIPKNDCIALLNLLNQQIWEKHTWHNKSSNEFHSNETKELDVFYGNEKTHSIVKPYMFNSIEKYCNEFMNGPQNIKSVTPVRFNKYSIGHMMRPHYDHIHSIFDGNKKGIPILSIVGILNDNYEGGDFLFGDNGNHKIKLKTGNIMIFPSNFLYPHAVMEIKNGVRHSCVSWAF